MINISIRKPVKLKSYDEVLYVEFNYNPTVVSIIKGRKVKAFDAVSKGWEVSIGEFTELEGSLEEYCIEYATPKDEILKLVPKDTKPKIKIRAGASKKLKGYDKSLFALFSYNASLVAGLKELKGRYNPTTTEWEIPVESYEQIVAMSVKEGFVVDKTKDVDSAVTHMLNRNKIINESRDRDWNSILKDYEFKTTPYSYQLDGIMAGLKNNVLLLTDEQGLGKTLQAIYTADIKSRVEGYKYTLIVCGVNGLKYNWLSEIDEHIGEEGYILGSRVNRKGRLVDGNIKERLACLDRLESYDIENRFIITNIETLRNKDIKNRVKDLCLKDVFGMIIIDEMHRVSNTRSSQGESLEFLKSRNRIGLTGTPVVNKPFDLYAPLRWLDIEKRSEYEFKQCYGEYTTKYGQGREYEELVGYKNLTHLKEILNGVMLRREKNDVLDLPDVVYMQETIDLNKEQQTLYKSIKDDLIDQIEDIVLDKNPLARFTRLRQSCSCSSALDSSISKNAKYHRVLEIIDDLRAEGKKAIVYSNFAYAVRELNELLKQSKAKSYTVTGEEKNKKEEIDKFRKDGDVLIGSIKALGTGYTITEASTIIFLDLPWTYADMIQAVDRAHRIGQNNRVTVISLLARDTVDEKMYKIVKKKQDLFDDMMEGKDIKGVNRRKLTKSLLGL